MKPRETKAMKKSNKNQYTFKMMVNILKKNGYVFSHYMCNYMVYIKDGSKEIIISKHLSSTIFLRIIKEKF